MKGQDTMGKRQLKKRLKENFGKIPDVNYAAGDMGYIREYYDYCSNKDTEKFSVDDITWHDVDMDKVFKRINLGNSTPGEQYLYNVLRHPVISENEFKKREDMIDFMMRSPENRLNVQVILAQLGRNRRSDISTAFSPAYRGRALLIVYIFLSLAAVSAFVFASFNIKAMFAVFGLFVFNSMLRELILRNIQKDFDTVNFSVGMVFALYRIKKLKITELDSYFSNEYESLGRLRSVIRTGGVSSSGGNDIGDFISMVLLLDLITYEFLKTKLWSKHAEIMDIFKALGEIDTAIAVASYRKSVDHYCKPELQFEDNKCIKVEAVGIVHPLLKKAVANDLNMTKPILITGSNASGKSTYLKTVVINAILAQSICTALADKYIGNVFYIYSSMALTDNILAGESYYIAEIRSIKRIIDAGFKRKPILCAVDEVLRGTNTVERISASSEILTSLERADVLCIAATHDIELCNLLSELYELNHFEEKVNENGMRFDYKIKDGAACSRNAIKLLEIMGFDENIVRRAELRAESYMKSGRWM